MSINAVQVSRISGSCAISLKITPVRRILNLIFGRFSLISAIAFSGSFNSASTPNFSWTLANTPSIIANNLSKKLSNTATGISVANLSNASPISSLFLKVWTT